MEKLHDVGRQHELHPPPVSETDGNSCDICGMTRCSVETGVQHTGGFTVEWADEWIDSLPHCQTGTELFFSMNAVEKTFLFEDFIPHCRRPFIPYCSIANRFYIVLNSCCSRLKGHSTKFTHYSLFIGVGEYYCICEKSQIKHFVASEEADKLPPVISLNAWDALWVM